MKDLYIPPHLFPFDLDRTLSCGQVFRWRRNGPYWIGVISDSVVSLRQNGQFLCYEGIEERELVRYLNLDLNPAKVLECIRSSIKQNNNGEPDLFFETAVTAGRGLRIIRQDPWECLISFICSQNSNIPAIQKRIDLICSRYGTPLPGGGFRFPTVGDLSSKDTDMIRECSTGYRASYLVDTARYIARNPDFLSRLSLLPPKEAQRELLGLPGVGPKVADCVLLFAYNFYEVVPIDVWIRTIMTNNYPELGKRACNRKECSYSQIAGFSREYFGQYAGYAQQFLFYARHLL
jgi:N-glycosylase/DNA lyase